jgi:2,3-bisphosphoglycerate-independent phosphoglycerate mutase
MSTRPKPFVLLILDGFGLSDQTQHNAIAQATTPHWDHLWTHYPHTTLDCSGHSVGLPDAQMGNSEVGHMHLGAGRLIEQDLTRIDQAIDTGTFQNHPTLLSLFESLKTADKNPAKQPLLHVMGLLSDGGVHSHIRHFKALIDAAFSHGIHSLCFHTFLDGRDTPPQSAEIYLDMLSTYLNQYPVGRIATLCGRYYAMDRDTRWDRTSRAYQLLMGTPEYTAPDIATALREAYTRGETDEFVKPTQIGKPTPLYPQDHILWLNFRADRARQLCQALIDPSVLHLKPHLAIPIQHCTTLTQYDETFQIQTLFQPQSLKNTVGEYFQTLHFQQLRIAETEKYAHVTFFLNGGREKPFEGESRILIPSPQVKTYDLKPEMSAPELTRALVEAIHSQRYDVIICNYANADMVGHTGIESAAITAIEAIDTALGEIMTALKETHGEMLVTADHGNAEYLYDTHTQQPHTAHTHNPVPLVYFGRAQVTMDHLAGSLIDVAPTLLYLLHLDKPDEMTGKSLFTFTTP